MNMVWAMFFGQVVGMRLHPGHHMKWDDHFMEDCARMADAMFALYVARFAAPGGLQ